MTWRCWFGRHEWVCIGDVTLPTKPRKKYDPIPCYFPYSTYSKYVCEACGKGKVDTLFRVGSSDRRNVQISSKKARLTSVTKTEVRSENSDRMELLMEEL